MNVNNLFTYLPNQGGYFFLLFKQKINYITKTKAKHIDSTKNMPSLCMANQLKLRLSTLFLRQ